MTEEERKAEEAKQEIKIKEKKYTLEEVRELEDTAITNKKKVMSI